MKTFVIGDVHGRAAQLRELVAMLPRDPARDALVLLGDLVDRGEDVPGTVDEAIRLCRDAGAICLRGNHEQMLLDFVDTSHPLWLHQAVGSEQTIEQYVGRPMELELYDDFDAAQQEIADSIPRAHIEFFRRLPIYHEDEYAIYVHAGLDGEKHPRETSTHHLLWSRDPNFFKSYHGKPCIFGHTPTPLLPLLGRIGRHGIYISHSAIGIDTGYNYTSPLSCLQLPDFVLYQTYADGRTAQHRINTFIPEAFRAFRKEASAQ